MRLLLNVNQPLGLSPQGVPKKEIAPLVAAAIIAAGATAASAGASAAAQHSASKKNKELQDETNQMNYMLAQEQKDFAREMYNKQLGDNRADAALARQQSLQDRNYENWYNSPQQQMIRYRQAGLNPYLMMDNNAPVGSVQATPQSVTPASANMPAMPTMVAPQYDTSWIQTMSQGIQSAGMQLSDVAMRAAQQDADLIKVLVDSHMSWENKNRLLKSHTFTYDKYQTMGLDILEEQYNQEKYKTAMAEVTTLFQQELNDESRKQFGRNQQLHLKTINQMEATIQNLLKQGKLYDTEGQVKEAALKQIESQAKDVLRYENNAPEWVKTFIAIVQRVFGSDTLGRLLSR